MVRGRWQWQCVVVITLSPSHCLHSLMLWSLGHHCCVERKGGGEGKGKGIVLTSMLMLLLSHLCHCCHCGPWVTIVTLREREGKGSC